MRKRMTTPQKRLAILGVFSFLVTIAPAVAAQPTAGGVSAESEAQDTSCTIEPGVDNPTYNNTCPDWVSSFTAEDTDTFQGNLTPGGSPDGGWSTRPAPNGELLVTAGWRWQGKYPALYEKMVLVATRADTGERMWWREYSTGVLPQTEFPGYVGSLPMAVAFSPDSSHIYVTGKAGTAMGGESNFRFSFVLKVDAATGETVWATSIRTLTEKTWALSEPRGMEVSPDGNRIYVTGDLRCTEECTVPFENVEGPWGQLPFVAALDASSGDVLWRTDDPEADPALGWLTALSPDGKRLYQVQALNAGGPVAPYPTEAIRLVAYDTATGEQVWNDQYDYPPESGQQLWRPSGPQVPKDIYGAPVGVAVSPDGSRIFVTTSHAFSRPGAILDTNFLALAWDTATGELAWEFESDWSKQSGCTDGWDVATGTALSPTGNRLYVFGSVIVDPQHRGARCANDKRENATVGLLALSTDTGEENWSSLYRSSEHELGASMFINGHPLIGENYILSANVHVSHGAGPGDEGSQVYVNAQAHGSEDPWLLELGFDGVTGQQVWQARYTNDAAYLDYTRGPKTLGGALSPDGGTFYVASAGTISGLTTNPEKITIVAYPTAGDLPTAALTATPASGGAPLGVSFDASGSRANNSGEAITRYRFDFGDGSEPVTETSPTVTHTYEGAGTYTATVMVFGERGGVAWATETISVATGPGPEPTPTPTPTGEPTPPPTGEPTPTPTASPTPVPTPTQPPGERGAYPQTPNDPYFGPGEDVDPLGLTRFGTQWGPQTIEANQAWQENRTTGHGIDVAVLDTGVDLGHPDLACSGKLEVVSGSDVVANDSVPNDENGHGTHVAGIIGACTNNGQGIAGVAPDATIVPIRVLNASGSGTDAQLITGINRAVAAGAEVINMSLGYPPGKEIINDVSGIDAAIEAAAAQGVVIVASAGNDSFPLCEYPALAEDVICVGATDARDNKAWYSTLANKSAGPAVVAPGGVGTVFCDVDSEEILSLYARAIDEDEGDCDRRPGYNDLAGTSMAAPHVAGVAALVYDRLGGERSPENAQKVIDAITSTAVDLGPEGYDPVYGSGRIDALEAVLAVEAVDPNPTSTPTTDPSSTPTTDPSSTPTTDPSSTPTTDPSSTPTTDPSSTPTTDPSSTPTTDPSSTPTTDPTTDPGPTTPAAPSNLTARAASSSRIELAWADHSNNETGFALERSLNGSSWQEIASAGRDATFHLDMGLDPDTSYFYRVRALNPTGYSGYSNTASATTMRYEGPGGAPNQAPVAPSNLGASSSSPSRIELSWSDSSNNEDGFALERSADGNSWQEIATTGRNQTSYLDTGLAANTTYQYRVRAYNSAGHSTYSNSASARTQQAPANGGGGGGGGGGSEPSPSPTQSSSPPVKPTLVGTATTSIAASRSLTTYNEGFELSGVVERDQNCTGPLEVEVSRRIHGTNTYESLSSTAVNGAGAWGLQVVGQRNAAYVAEVKETDTCQGDPSVPTDVLVRAEIAVRVPEGCAGSIRGEVLPANEGEVVLQRRAKGRWNEVAGKSLDDESRFDLRAKRCGKYRLVWAEDGAANEPARQRFRLY